MLRGYVCDQRSHLDHFLIVLEGLHLELNNVMYICIFGFCRRAVRGKSKKRLGNDAEKIIRPESELRENDSVRFLSDFLVERTFSHINCNN